MTLQLKTERGCSMQRAERQKIFKDQQQESDCIYHVRRVRDHEMQNKMQKRPFSILVLKSLIPSFHISFASILSMFLIFLVPQCLPISCFLYLNSVQVISYLFRPIAWYILTRFVKSAMFNIG